MYSSGVIKVMGASAVGAGSLAYTGFDTPLFLFLGVVAMLAGALMVRTSRLKRGRR